VVGVEEEFQDFTVWCLILVLVYSCLKSFNSSTDHPINKQSPCSLIPCKCFIIEITVEHHHFINKRLICEWLHGIYLIEISRPYRVRIFRCLFAAEFGWVLLHQHGHVIYDLLMRICQLLKNHGVISPSILFLFRERAV
jgi:hypothetical protein